ncbi:UbiD family decarboxylase domain-containing protein [Streptomyces sioyaensis]|uniref:UbiD family decarboxylase domain-containing protein n=1 Tax=Streptomyces sioyaensis TaxID=67364 RepID=UPI0033CF1E02
MHGGHARAICTPSVRCHLTPTAGTPPKTVSRSEAEVKLHVLLGADADLTRFPVPFVHEKDGKRYANTYGVIIARIPDESWTNWSRSSPGGSATRSTRPSTGTACRDAARTGPTRPAE